VLFPFGFGLSYTTYSYSDLKVSGDHEPTVRFSVKNTGSRAGSEIAEIYASLPEGSGEPPKRLIGWSKVALAPGESKEVSVTIDPKYLSIYDVDANAWKLLPGGYTIQVGGSSNALDLSQKLELK